MTTNKLYKYHHTPVLTLLPSSTEEKAWRDLIALAKTCGKTLRPDVQQALNSILAFVEEMKVKPLDQITLIDLNTDLHLDRLFYYCPGAYSADIHHNLGQHLADKARQEKEQQQDQQTLATDDDAATSSSDEAPADS